MRHLRLGFTLIEVLVALTLIGVGITAWVSTGTLGLRIAGIAERESSATFTARAAVARIAARRCGVAGSGLDGDTRWRVELLSNGVRRIRAERTFRSEKDTTSAIAEMVTVCR